MYTTIVQYHETNSKLKMHINKNVTQCILLLNTNANKNNDYTCEMKYEFHTDTNNLITNK